ncbi:MAG: cytochrome b/b6 domain-containing protein [Ignavibacteriae bacterium]|nr:cytochrome b/b6 domain-containing protein [Ignavibacteriota bacterium]
MNKASFKRPRSFLTASSFRRTILFLMPAAAVLSGAPAYSQTNSDCFLCHSERSLTMSKKGKSVSLFVDESSFKGSAHGNLECVSCHENFKADDIPHARRIRPVNCSNCHDGEKAEQYSHSVHGVAGKDGRVMATCADCHTTHTVKKISDKQSPEAKEFAAHMCAKCHGAVNEKYMQSDHGLALMAGVKGSPSCIDCHGEHNIVSPAVEGSPTSRVHEAEICLGCHLDNPKVRARVGPSAGFISSYENSVHGQAVKHGNKAAATCTDCHGSHEMKKGANPASKVAKANIASTCGQCHGDIRMQFDWSVHGKTLAAGVIASPTCTDCHGEHNILSPKDDRAPVSAKNVSAQVCSPCHASVKLTEKYGLAGDRFKSFQDSYHGLANRAGSVEVANCASCHGVHDIKPSSDPSSRIHKANLVATCGTCHPGANENFTKGSVHVIATSGDDELLYLVATGYLILIFVVIASMFFHNFLDFIKKSKRKLMQRRGLIPHKKHSHRLYLRMSLSERIQHGTLLVSFITLVITGFALKYPDAWWVVSIRSLSPVVLELRGIVHRVAGVVMVVAGLYHLYYVLFVPRGKQLIRDLLPVRQDINDLVGVMKYNLGYSSVKPRLGRFSYIEKSEYWALVWGTIVMAITGVILWFDNTFLGLITKLWWDVARTVHYYEAWLATLAIVVWHFYFVIFNPDTYPMNLSWWKGTLTEEEMDEEHPLELEEVQRRRALDEVQDAGKNDGEREAEKVTKV